MSRTFVTTFCCRIRQNTSLGGKMARAVSTTEQASSVESGNLAQEAEVSARNAEAALAELLSAAELATSPLVDENLATDRKGVLISTALIVLIKFDLLRFTMKTEGGSTGVGAEPKGSAEIVGLYFMLDKNLLPLLLLVLATYFILSLLTGSFRLWSRWKINRKIWNRRAGILGGNIQKSLTVISEAQQSASSIAKDAITIHGQITTELAQLDKLKEEMQRSWASQLAKWDTACKAIPSPASPSFLKQLPDIHPYVRRAIDDALNSQPGLPPDKQREIRNKLAAAAVAAYKWIGVDRDLLNSEFSSEFDIVFYQFRDELRKAAPLQSMAKAADEKLAQINIRLAGVQSDREIIVGTANAMRRSYVFSILWDLFFPLALYTYGVVLVLTQTDFGAIHLRSLLGGFLRLLRLVS